MELCTLCSSPDTLPGPLRTLADLPALEVRLVQPFLQPTDRFCLTCLRFARDLGLRQEFPQYTPSAAETSSTSSPTASDTVIHGPSQADAILRAIQAVTNSVGRALPQSPTEQAESTNAGHPCWGEQVVGGDHVHHPGLGHGQTGVPDCWNYPD